MLWPELQVDSSVNTQVYRNKHRAQGLRTMKFLTLVSRMYGISLNTSSSTRVDARRQRALSEGSAMALVLPVPSSLLCLPYQPGSGCFKDKKKKKDRRQIVPVLPLKQGVLSNFLPAFITYKPPVCATTGYRALSTS